ncbi:capsular biosynthesis protein [Cytophagales bacterium LB-30]|uniref:protein-tyrosine-phosphatase n=1 Tax=Shiella aurantiaca TaxID=3058365 RepID=A0ABT8F8X3_9BACT|nr:CpsB/CapC family capsule biosynthesis tyrosine phosphatase [Shiella aurantiaca]MDN4166819.1 capsular biosynthesis protein [Shiella aurantiaca]
MGLFSKKTPAPFHFSFGADMHSHLLPGIDDGASTIETSLILIERMQALGIRQCVTTPHIMGDFYRNTPEIINQKLKEVQVALREHSSSFVIQAAAEYHIDDFFMNLLEKPEPLLSFGKRYVLVEMPFMSISIMWKEALFALQSMGYQPILAHPERYVYFHENERYVQDFLDRGVLMQINLNSLTGYYSKPARKLAEKLIDKKAVHFVGTDCHHIGHLEVLEQLAASKYLKKLQALPLLNASLVE